MLGGIWGVLIILLTVSGVFAALLLGFPRIFGAYAFESANQGIELVILALGTFAGVLSNSIYARLSNGKESLNLVGKRDVVLSAVVSPIIMFPIYQTLQASQNLMILALTSYQNGFFFNSWFDKLLKERNAPR